MKKFIALLLVLVMTLPMCLVAQAEDASTEIRPYYLLNWSALPEEVTSDNVFHLFSMWTRDHDGTDAEELYVIAKDYGIGNDIVEMAAGMKEEFDSRPVGARYMMITTRMGSSVDKWVFLDKGMNLFKDYLDKLLAEFKSIGGQLDGLIIDMEYNEYIAYNLDKVYQDDPFIYKSIVDDERYQERIRPALEERGFKFFPEADNEYRTELYSINSKAGAEYAQSRSIWDAVMHEQMIWHMNEGCSPLFKYYPEANLSNYRSYAAKSWLKTMNNRGELVGNATYVGNTTNENSYFYKPAGAYFKNANTNELTFNHPVSYNNVSLDATKFNMLMWDLGVFKQMMMASDTENMSAWVIEYDYTNTDYSGCKSPYYAETYLHIGMMNPMHFLGYVTDTRAGDDYAYCMEILGDIMAELTRVGGAADRKYIKMPHNWNTSFALTGMYAGGRNIWRITPDTTYVTREEFLVEGAKDPTFYVNGQTVTFPGGKIVEDGSIREVGTCGYWVETPTDVMPIVTSDVDRYRMFPAFGEDFDGYETGMEYTYNNVEYVTSWQIKKGKTATAVIQEDKDNAGNKVLALTGDFTMKNARVVEKVTAGDTYAEDQAWEVTVTLPANMGAEAEAMLLSIYGDKSKALDGGFKVAGGKVYYYNTDDYVELAGVDVSAGGKYTFKRNMDFNTADAFTCDYTVYDAEGKALATAKNIPVNKSVKVPVQSVGMEFSDIAETLLVDDYRIYASGVATDLELYEAKFGQKLTNLEEASATNTAYRVSWMNATAKDKVYSIVAAYYNGDKLVEEKVIKELKMAPNTDAVETGIVEVAEGQSVRVYVRNDNAPETDEGDNIGTPGDTTKPAEEVPVMLIAIIAGAVVLVAAIVVVIVVVSKNKKAAPAAEEKAEDAEDNAAE